MAQGMTRSTDTGISNRTRVHFEREALKQVEPVRVLDKVATTKSMPKNKNTTVSWRRAKPYVAATTPLMEGVTPTPTKFEIEVVTASLKQYGQISEITDVIEDTHEDPILNDMAMEMGQNIARTMESLDYGVYRAGTNVIYANGVSRAAVNTPLTLTIQRNAVRTLKRQKAKKITRTLAPGTGFATRAVEASYVAVGHTDLENEIRGLPGFTQVAEYGNRSPICDEEIGSVEDVRYVLSPDLESFADAGGAAGAMVSTSGSNADVYPIMYFGQDAVGTVALKGFGAIDPSIIPVGQKTKDDPLGQRGVAGWKTWHAAVILNQTWLVRAEVASTQL